MINNFDKLKVLEKSHLFTLKIYKLIRTFPSDEKFRLIDQICRSSSSVPANIVEGNSIFFIDFDGHKDDENVKKVLLKHQSSVKVLGSYVKEINDI